MGDEPARRMADAGEVDHLAAKRRREGQVNLLADHRPAERLEYRRCQRDAQAAARTNERWR